VAGSSRADVRSDGPTLASLVSEIANELARAGILHPTTEARDLIAAVLDRPRFWPALHAAEQPPPDVVRAIRRAARRRVLGAPFAYAVGKAAFRFLTLSIDERVLIPRPETELLVELVLATTQGRGGGVAADIGTGSGAIALALAAEGRFTRVIATDISADALRVAGENVRRNQASLRAPVALEAGAGLAPLHGLIADVIVSNPPYIAFEEMAALPSLVRDWEPAQALCCADRGLAVTRDLIAHVPRALRSGGLFAIEVDSRRAQLVGDLARSSGAFSDVSVRRDYTGRERFVLATRASND
jgi:release factor glutamine methyltransferase